MPASRADDCEAHPGQAPLHVLQVTDCHLFGQRGATQLGVDTAASLDAVLDAAFAERAADAVLATGDIAQQPSADTYALFQDILAKHHNGPLLCVPGNHDHGATFAACLPTADLGIGGWRIVGIDTHVDDQVGGSVAPADLERLADAVQSDASTLVVGHHCPALLGCRWLDAHRIDNAEALLAALDARAVKGYAFGHIHHAVEQSERQAGVRLMGTPSTCYQFAPHGATFAIDAALPGYRWLELHPDGALHSRVGRASEFALNIDLKDRG